MSKGERTSRPLVRPLVTVALAALVLSPLARPRGWDSFPISSYPMFSRGDLGQVLGLAHAVLLLGDGTRRPVPLSVVGTPEPMIATSIVRSNIERGTAAGLCTSIAARARDAALDAVAVEIVTSFFDTRRYFSEAAAARTPLRREVHARCDIGR